MGVKITPTVILCRGMNPVRKNAPVVGKTLLMKKGKKPKLYCITPDCGFEKIREEE